MANVKTNTLPTAAEYVAEYMARMNQPKPVIVKTITQRASLNIENAWCDMVADSKVVAARTSEAWKAADEVAAVARIKERERQAYRAAARLGLS